jgi:hypothetical protein
LKRVNQIFTFVVPLREVVAGGLFPEIEYQIAELAPARSALVLAH